MNRQKVEELILHAMVAEVRHQKDYTPSEKYALGRKLEALLATPPGRPSGETVEKFHRSDRGKTRDKVGGVFKMSGKTWDKLKAIQESGHDDLIKKLDKCGRIDPIYRLLSDRQESERIEAEDISPANDGLNVLQCCECLDYMRSMASGSVDLVVTSPPYNLRNSTSSTMNSDNQCSKWASAALRAGYDNHDDKMPHDQYVAWQRQCLTEMVRLLKEDGAVFYNHKWRVQDGVLQDRHDIVEGFPVRQIIIWRRKGGFNFNSSYFLPTYEVIYVIAKKDFRLVDHANAVGDVWDIAQEKNNPHPAPFPVLLVHRIISSTNAKVVLDPFSGSGTVAVVARHLGRNYICVDNSETYHKMARARLERNKGCDEVAEALLEKRELDGPAAEAAIA